MKKILLRLVILLSIVSFSVTGCDNGDKATTPGKPQAFIATSGDKQVVLSWEAPADDGGSAIIRYQVYINDSTSWANADSGTSHTFTGLDNGTSYTFKVRAVNAEGNGAEASTTATPVGASGAPQTFIAVPGDKQVILSWAVPADNGGSIVTGYQVSFNNGTSWVRSDSETSHTFTGLINAATYTFKVRAINAIGTGAEASTTAIPFGIPDAPDSFIARPGNAQVTLVWTAPASNGGRPITGYQVSDNDGASWVNADTETTHTFTGLVNGANYTFKVHAVNAAGNGAKASLTATPDIHVEAAAQGAFWANGNVNNASYEIPLTVVFGTVSGNIVHINYEPVATHTSWGYDTGSILFFTLWKNNHVKFVDALVGMKAEIVAQFVRPVGVASGGNHGIAGLVIDGVSGVSESGRNLVSSVVAASKKFMDDDTVPSDWPSP